MTTTRTGRVAYCTVPKIGGTFNFYCNLRRALEPLGWELLAPSVGRHVNALWDDHYVEPGCLRLVPDEPDLPRQARALVDWCQRESIDILIPMSVQAAVSALPHLPKSTRAIYRCSNITRHAYDIVTEHLPYAHRVVATSKRQFDDLSRQRGVPVNKLRLIPHGADTSAFVAAYQSRATEEGPIRLVYLGRLLDSAKGIFLLPRIASRLERLGVAYTLTVIGDGPDRGEFERRFADRSTSPVMLGSQPHAAVPGLLASADVLLMPSRFEGFGFSLIEAMAAGVVPIVARVVGVTDWIVDDQETGFVCGIDDADAFARQVADLAGDRQRWAQMSRKAHGVASEKFGLARLGRDYDDLFREVLSQPADTPDPRPWSAFRASPAFEPTFRRYIPEGIKARLRSWSERLRGWRGT